ncbi:MAG TPA: hypothetical protein VKG92_08240, partial [Flavobacteriales bacterium]|nr:hypothetical protein [Flavobacteriales bacterium]
LSYANRFKRELLISAAYNNGTASHDLVQLPVAIEFPGLSGKVIEQKNTDPEGHVRANIQGVDPEAAAKEVVVRLDLRALVSKELDPTLVKALMSSLTVPEQRAAIDLRMPKVFMRAQETNLGAPVRDAGLSVMIREELTRKGFRFVEREADADMILQLNASTRQGGEASGFFTAFLDVSYSFRDRLTQDVLHEGGRQGVKGVQLNYEKAGLEAYKKAAPDVRKDLVPGMMSALQ